MTAVLGYFLCLAALMPALSLDVFLGLLRKTPRQHDVLALMRTIIQLLATVTSPFKIALTLAVLLCAYAIESGRFAPGKEWFIACVLGFGGLQFAALSFGPEFGAASVMLPCAMAILASFSGTSIASLTSHCADGCCASEGGAA
jgi:hypothetical protein